MKTFGELFVEGKGAPIEFNGQSVVASHFVTIEEACEFVGKVEVANPTIKQAITISMSNGKVEHKGSNHKSAICWYDHEPWVMIAGLKPGKKEPARLCVWNSWLTNGRTDAWIGNAGMIVEQCGEKMWRARCSNGVGEVSFSDFVFTFELRPYRADSPGVQKG